MAGRFKYLCRLAKLSKAMTRHVGDTFACSGIRAKTRLALGLSANFGGQLTLDPCCVISGSWFLECRVEVFDVGSIFVTVQPAFSDILYTSASPSGGRLIICRLAFAQQYMLNIVYDLVKHEAEAATEILHTFHLPMSFTSPTTTSLQRLDICRSTIHHRAGKQMLLAIVGEIFRFLGRKAETALGVGDKLSVGHSLLISLTFPMQW